LQSGGLLGSPFARPEDVVAWFGAVQAQDYAGAKWGVAQRTAGATDAAIDRLVDAGRILRTHVLRPTWHFVMPADIRWMLSLTAPRAKAASAHQYRQLELDERVIGRAHAAMVRAMEGGHRLTRPEIARVCGQADVDVSGGRLAMVVMLAELDALVCSGPRRGRQFTYALLDERVPPSNALEREAALAELAARYFTGHGPAGAADFAWWSGLTLTDARTAIDAAGAALVREVIDGRTYWTGLLGDPAADGRQVRSLLRVAASGSTAGASAGGIPGGRSPGGPVAARSGSPGVHLLPNYDEFTVGYRDRRAFVGPEMPNADATVVLSNVVVRDGRVAGTWRRVVERDRVVLVADLAAPLDAAGRAGLERAAARYGDFLEMPVALA
jgi:hypothetical protein